MGFEIGQAVLIETYSGWIGPDIFGFDSKLYKGEIPIAETKGRPLFGGWRNKHVSWCFDMGELSAWGRQILEPGISRAPENGEKEDWGILEFAKHESPPYKAKRVKPKQAKRRNIACYSWLQISVVGNGIITHWERDKHEQKVSSWGYVVIIHPVH